MSINLNNPGGIDKLVGKASSVVGGVSSLLTSLTGLIGNNWDIDEGSYGHDGNQILFHVFKTPTDDFDAAVSQVQDNGGHRKVPIIFPYVDGQSTDDLGRAGESFDIDILIFGPNYKEQYQDLLLELDDPRPGTLIHPVRGQIEVAAETWVVTHASDKKQAVALKVRFLEHSFSVDYSQIPVADNVPSALTAAIGFISKISAAITFVKSLENVATNTKTLVSRLLASYGADYTATLTQLNQTFNQANASTIPGLTPLVAGQSDSVFNVATTFTDVFTGTEQLTQSQTTANQQLSSALATQQAIDIVIATRLFLESALEQIEATESNQGSLIFYDVILMLKQSAIATQDVLDLGIQTSNNTIITFLTPRDMSVREICFLNGLSPDNSEDIEILNPELQSLNFVQKGTIVKVPV